MKRSEFLKREHDTLKKPTLYVQGGWGQRLTQDVKIAFTTNPLWPFNQKPERKAKIMAAPENTIAGDCVCIQKSIIDNLVGVNDQTSAMRKPCPDITIQAIMNMCSNVRDVSYNKEPNVGDFLAYPDFSHCGIYMGNGEVSECTYSGTDGLQLRQYAGRGWKWAGHLPWIEDDDDDINPAPVVTTIPAVQICACRDQKNIKAVKGTSVFHVGGWYKQAFTYTTMTEARANLASVRAKYGKGCFLTEYKSDTLVNKF